jgi:hypothetical protein
MNTPRSWRDITLSGLWLALKIAVIVLLMHTGQSIFVYQRF